MRRTSVKFYRRLETLIGNIPAGTCSRLAIAGVAALLLTACGGVPERYVAPPAVPKAIAHGGTDCPAGSPDNCAIISPIQELAQKVFRKTGVDPVHYASIVEVGEEALALRIHLIRAARISIEVQTFIWDNDAVGRLLIQELISAARRGVNVRIIADQLYSGKDAKNLARLAVTHERLQVKLFNPVSGIAATSMAETASGFLTDFAQANRRMHNKLLVVDARIGLTGGRNIEDAYYGRDQTYNFLDRDVLVVGPVAADMQGAFDTYWNNPIAVDLDQHQDVHNELFQDGRQVPTEPWQPIDIPELSDLIKWAVDNAFIEAKFVAPASAVEQVSFWADPPQKGFGSRKEKSETTAPIKDVVLGARNSLLVQTPYLLLSPPTASALHELHEDNPALEITAVTNSLASTDAFFVYGMTMKYRKAYLDRVGMRIYELKPIPGALGDLMPSGRSGGNVSSSDIEEEEIAKGKALPIASGPSRVGIHAKSIVVDEEIALIGSHNLDPRSFALNTEVILIIRDKQFASRLARNIQRFTRPENSWVVARRQKVPIIGHFGALLAGISRLLPIFDIWPFRYTSNYELRPGGIAVSPDEPAFYENYNNVGQFPNVSLSGKKIKALLVSGFGAVAEPLM